MTRTAHTFAYARPSSLTAADAGQALNLETASGLTPTGADAHPQFFAGFLSAPQAAARALLAVADVAAARYYQRTLRASLDPVVTGNGDRLRFESFSGCCGVYARLDVLPDGLRGADTGHGTTNVDVNNPLREALSRLSGDDPLHLRVGPDAMAVTTLDGPVVEKKVPLPERWLRGFAESQAVTRRELRASRWERWRERDLMSPALAVAGAACTTGAAAAAAWIGAADLRRWRPQPPTAALLDVLSGRDPQWLGKLAHRLADRPTTAEQDYPLISALVRLAGCETPTTDGCVEGWAAAVAATGSPLVDALRRDPHVTAFAPRLFETAEPVRALERRWETADHNQWPGALAVLADEGCLDRAALLDGCTARLLRGGKPAHLKPYQAILEALRPTAEEERERAADWIAMAADAPSAVAGTAQQTLARVAAAGHLTPRMLAEMSGAVLFRTEKKLVRAQLVLIGKELTRDPSAAPELLPELGEAFGHSDTDIQERAVNLARP
ncbi:hypothetical protein [Streptomyces sp. NPDC090131]|uniref:hypothetical protein n=1 Tax=Streptomyces sp. NPDC090131 TaxID=3365954 RepID=UPI003802E348